MRLADIFMLEYSYVAFKKREYLDHVDDVINIIRDWILYKIPDINKRTLEQTLIMFRTRRNNEAVVVGKNRLDSVIRPTVSMYYDINSDHYNIDESVIYEAIGKILNKYFSKRYIDINAIESEIEKVFPDALKVKLSNYALNDPAIINITRFSNRFEIAKKVDVNFNVVYDYDLKIERI